MKLDNLFYEKLLALSRDMAQTRDLQPLLQYAMHAALDLVEAEQGHMILLDEDVNIAHLTESTMMDYLTFAISITKDDTPLPYPQTQVSKSILARTFQSREALVITDAQSEDALRSASVKELQLQSVMCVPLKTMRHFLGVIYLENRSQTHIFTQESLLPLSYFASQAAVFIENARLTGRLEEHFQQSTQTLVSNQLAFNTMMNNIREAVWAVDKHYQLLFGNRAFLNNFEMSFGAYLGEGDNILKLLPTATSVIWKARYDRAFRGEQFTLEDTFTLSGNITHQEISVAPILRADNTVSGAVVFSRDISQRKQVEYALKNAKEEAEAANRAKITFLSSMSHNLRTQMNAIIGFTEVLLRDATLSAQQRGYLEIIANNSNNHMTLLNDILEMAQIEAGRVNVQEQPFDLHYLLKTLELRFAPLAREKNLDFILEEAPQLPQWIKADGGKIAICLRHLLGNAVRFTEQGQVTLRTEAHYQDDQLMLFFEVKDTGIGIPKSIQTEIFKPFGRIRIGGDDMNGTGLGLPITKQLIEMMGGSLQLNSTPGVGTQVGFWLMVTQPEESIASQYHSDEVSQYVQSLSQTLSPQALAQLPGEWVDALARTVLEIDMEQALSIVENIAHYDASLAVELRQLVKAYRFDVLQKLLQEAKH